jgi:hypothetical protein
VTPILVLVGALSMYHPGDGHNRGILACGGKFEWGSHHIAIRQWRRVGCGAPARVCVGRRCVWTTVRDSGPWGAIRGKRWQVQIKLRPGWKRRGVVDLSWLVWVELGSPKWLSSVRVEVFKWN